jgi:hypothetical protein
MSEALEGRYSVVSPEVGFVRPVLTPTAALKDLAGRRIGLIWDYRFHGDLVFSVIRRELSERFPGVTFVGHEAFGDVHGPREREVLEDLPRRLLANGCEAAIVAIGA